jgi:hypothetical protein
VLAAVSALLLAAAAPPEPTILQAPPATTTTSSATFTFRVIGRTYDYECKVGDKLARFARCTSPHTVTGLGVGTHTFQVRALEGNAAGLPASHTWTITALDDDGTDPAPPPAPVPTVAPAPAPTPTPTPAPAPAAPKPKLSVTLSYFMTARKRETRFSSLSVKGVPRGATVKVTCSGGCPRRSQTFRKSGTVALTGYRHKALRVGAKLTIAVTKPGTVGTAKVVTIRSEKRPRITTKTLRERSR